MDGSNIVSVIVPPCASHAFRLFVIRHHIVIVCEFLVTDCAIITLVDDFAIEKLSHLGGRAQFPVSSRVVWVVNALNTEP